MIDVTAQIAEPLGDGVWVNSKINSIIEVIRIDHPTLDVRWIPRDKRDPEDAAFCIVEKLRDGREVVAFFVQTEADFDERVLARIYQADMAKKGVTLEAIDAHNEAVKTLRMKDALDKEAERVDIAQHVLKSPLHVYKHDGKRYGEHSSTWNDHAPKHFTVTDNRAARRASQRNFNKG
jgi:hypothetical protein